MHVYMEIYLPTTHVINTELYSILVLFMKTAMLLSKIGHMASKTFLASLLLNNTLINTLLRVSHANFNNVEIVISDYDAIA